MAESSKPVSLPRLASRLPAEVAGIDSAEWAGFLSFRALVDSLRLDPLQVRWDVGVVLDPARHELTDRPSEASRQTAPQDSASTASSIQEPPAVARPGPTRVTATDWGSDANLFAVMHQVHAATGIPLISPTEMRAILDSLIEDLGGQPFQISETGKRVRDRCRDGGHAVSRSDVSFVLKGILWSGHKLGEQPGSREQLAQHLLSSVLDLCRREQLALDPGQTSQVIAWSNRAVA